MLVTEFPVNWLMQRYPIDRILAYCVIWWGVCVFGCAACQNFPQSELAGSSRHIVCDVRGILTACLVMACRVLLAIGEAGVNPGFLVLTTAWYKKSEQHLRAMIF